MHVFNRVFAILIYSICTFGMNYSRNVVIYLMRLEVNFWWKMILKVH